MVVRAALRVRHRGCVSEGLHDESVLTQVSGERGWDLFVLHAAPAELDAAFEHLHSNGTPRATVLTRTDRCIIFRGHNLPAGIIATIRESPCWIEWPVVYRDGLEHYNLAAPSREEMRALLQRIRAHGDVDVQTIVETAPEHADEQALVQELASGLTHKQLAALFAAAERGYYDEGRRVKTDDLAIAADLSPSTYREHLLKAERGLVKGFLRIAARYPDAIKSAARGPGRPPKTS